MPVPGKRRLALLSVKCNSIHFGDEFQAEWRVPARLWSTMQLVPVHLFGTEQATHMHEEKKRGGINHSILQHPPARCPLPFTFFARRGEDTRVDELYDRLDDSETKERAGRIGADGPTHPKPTRNERASDVTMQSPSPVVDRSGPCGLPGRNIGLDHRNIRLNV
ncbi:hypothetical protein F0562_035753 [Nyssa sinensis]|uniref:Uncharacterized protein n=1 Tax=Nyssa sinensis TaxID=561372 RepID=A0A5J5ADZ2_9ASTE|nr:hypothetical protein F0562_035753 [Nyssa sinensis]